MLASPVFRCLKKQLEDAEVHLLTKAGFKIVTEANPYIDKFFYYDNDLNSILAALKQEKYDFVIDLHSNIRSAKVCRSLKSKTFTIRKLNVEKFLLTKFNINLMPGRHITQRSLDTVEPLGVKDDGSGLDYFIPNKDVVLQSDIPLSHSAGYVAIAIGANHNTKKLPLHKLQELCYKVEHPIILLGGKEDAQTGAAIASLDDIKIYNACGKFNLNESADLVRRSKFLIAHDTGLLYIGCALQKPVLAIWGGTSPALDVEPFYGDNFRNRQQFPMFENIYLDLACQPCSKYGSARCPLEHFNCMQKQDVDLIVEKTHHRLRTLKI